MALNLELNTAYPDDVYQVLVDMHEGLSEAQSLRAYSKLTLLLANHVGDIDVIREAAAIARENINAVD